MKDLLLNFLIILAPLFLYQILAADRMYGKDLLKMKWWIGVMYGVAACLCMFFPINMGDEFIWDLRWVPFLIAILYGGVRGGMAASAILLLCRLYLGGGAAFYTVLIDVVLLLPLLLRIRPWFHTYSLRGKIVLSGLLSVMTYLFIMLSIGFYFVYRGDVWYLFQHSLEFYLFFGLLYLLSMTASVLLLENMQENARIRAEIQKSEKLQIITQLAASIAHEVRNPLTVVRGFIQLASSTMDETNRRYMHTAIEELDRAEFIISDYLNFAKPELDRLERIEAGDVLKHVINLMSSYATMQGAALSVEAEPGLHLMADSVKLKQVIMNLIKNSVEASSVGGGKINVQARRSGQQVVIEVIDNGPGMSQEELERLGSPFYSTKEKGTGLGLMVSFRIIEAMDGKLEFWSEPGNGTTAAITIPTI